MADSTILITGARGRIGSVIAQHWRGRYPILLDRAEGDLCVYEEGWVRRLAGVGTVFHLAAEPDPAAPFERTGAGNIAATVNVVRACIEGGVGRLIYASSIWADYGSWGIADRMTWYAASKVAGEAFVRAYADQTGRPAVCLRFGGYQPEEALTPELKINHLDAAAIAFHADAALAWEGPGCAVRYALGRLATGGARG